MGDFLQFDPTKFLDKYKPLMPFFNNPIQNHRLKDEYVKLWTKSKGAASGRLEEIFAKKPDRGKNKSITMDERFGLRVVDISLWYTLVWINETHFRWSDAPTVKKILCKAYYLALFEKTENISCGWNAINWKALTEKVRDEIDENLLVDCGKNTISL